MLKKILAIVFEITFFIVMFYPAVTWLYILGGTVFHTSLYFIHSLPFLYYICFYIVFIEPLRKGNPVQLWWTRKKFAFSLPGSKN